MHSVTCHSFQEELGFFSFSGSHSQEPHSNAMCSRQDSMRCQAWAKVIFEAFLSVWTFALNPSSE
jgi:hypothetical protein